MLARLTAIILLSAAGTALADPAFKPGRGVSMDQWVTWPAVANWNEPVVFARFPEWMHFVSDRDLDKLSQAGIDTVRVPLDPAFFLHGDDARRQRILLDRSMDAVKRLTRKGFKVIADMHTIPRADTDAAPGTAQIVSDPALFARYTRLVAETADRLSRFDPAMVALEVINEPVLGCGNGEETALWQQKLQDLHAAARNANPAITLVLTGSCWGSADGLSALDPAAIGDDNTLFVFHSYEPFLVTHQTAGWAGEFVRHLSGIPWPPEALSPDETEAMIAANRAALEAGAPADMRDGLLADFEGAAADLRRPDVLRARMERPFAVAAGWADRHGIARDRILLGEFGMIRQEYAVDFVVPVEWRAAYYRDMTRLAEEHGFAWSMWSFGGAFGLVQGFGGDPLAETPLTGLVRTGG